MSHAIQQILLKHMAKSTAANPCSFSDLMNMSKFAPDALQMQMDAMYESRLVSQVKHTKDGITQFVYWPTGLQNRAASFKSLDATLQAPVRRSEIKQQPIKPTSITEAEIMINSDQLNGDEVYIPIKQGTVITVENTGKSVSKSNTVEMMLSHLIKNGPTQAKVLAVLIGEKYAGNIPGRLTYLTTGDDAILKCTKTQNGNSFPVYTYEMVPGKTLQDFYDRKFVRVMKKTHEEINNIVKKTQADTLQSEQEVEMFGAEIPAFLPPEKPLLIADSPELQNDSVEMAAAYISPCSDSKKTPFDDEHLLADCIKTLLGLMPEHCHMTLRHPDHENIQVEIDGAILANPITVNLEKVSGVFGAINILQEVMQ
jgi:hypothetical protein